jgi:hypothetical protein
LWDRDVQFYRLPGPGRGATPGRLSRSISARRPALAIVTLYDKNFSSVGKLTAARMRRYAELQGYRFVEHRSTLDGTRSAPWNKILAAQQALATARVKWVLWLDADAVVMNFDFRLESLIVDGADAIFASDFNGLNSSAFLIRNCDWSKRFLETVYNLGDISYELDRFGLKWEQNTIKHVLNNFRGFAEHVAVQPERRMSASPGEYQPGDFILHLGGMPNEERLKILAELGD